MAQTPQRIKITLNKNTKYGNKTFEFEMTSHLQDSTQSGISTACNRIADWIITSCETDNWLNLPIWHLSAGFRICPIFPTNISLWMLLDGNSKKVSNWLIFKNHPQKSSVIRVTHFGPFGITKGNNMDNDMNNNSTKFKTKMAEYINILNARQSSVKEKDRAKQQFKAHIENNYLQVKSKHLPGIEMLKGLEDQYRLITKVFFQSGFDYEDKGEEFVQAFHFLGEIMLSA